MTPSTAKWATGVTPSGSGPGAPPSANLRTRITNGPLPAVAGSATDRGTQPITMVASMPAFLCTYCFLKSSRSCMAKNEARLG